MTVAEYTRLTAQIAVLKEIAMEYSCKTIDNIIVQMEARKKEGEKCPLSPKTNLATQRIGRRLERES